MKKGFSTLLVVIILGSFSLGLAIWISTSSLWSQIGSADTKVTEKTKALINACAEVALNVISDDNFYVGSNTVTIDGNDCNYEVVYNGGDSRTINVNGVIGNITRRAVINTTAFNPLIISSWQETP